MRLHPILFVLCWAACKDSSDGPAETTPPVVEVDEDGDGSLSGEDCDDNDPAVYPGATEQCDGLDNNCDGVADEGVTVTVYQDADADGYGEDSTAAQACVPGEGQVSEGGDCNDQDAAFHPGAEEADCTDPNDYNCDGSVGFADADADGFPACEDCDDSAAAVNPGATEVCDGVDNNCDGSVDDAASADAATWYADTDADGYGDGDYSTVACTQPSGYVADATDCDDTAPAVNPGATEVCNRLDDDCDGLVDTDDSSWDASSGTTWYSDSDGDGYGDPGSAVVACDIPSGYVTDATDCDDTAAATNPAAVEVCDSVDNNCDGTVDEASAADASTWYIDADGDGYGDASAPVVACDRPSGAVSNSRDCDDSVSAVYPGATELCDSVDNNCDGTVDEASAADASTWYTDADGDGYGDASSDVVACDRPSGTVSDATDCDDGAAVTFPGATELCDGADNDCDSTRDEGLLGTGAACPADSCYTALIDGQTTDGTYHLEGLTGAIFQTWCDQTRDGGGWTLIGSVVNEVHITGTEVRSWNSASAWTDTGTFGSLSTRQTADFKGEAYSEIAGDDYLVVTDEYGFGFYSLIGYQDFASFLASEYNSSTCSQTFLASGADWSENLSATQALAFGFVVRPLDDNAGTCFPTGNENAILGHHFGTGSSTCCWANGLGNTPKGYATWQVYDNSLLKLSNLAGGTCTAGKYPCNDAGYYMSGTNGYTYSSKVVYAELYVR